MAVVVVIGGGGGGGDTEELPTYLSILCYSDVVI